MDLIELQETRGALSNRLWRSDGMPFGRSTSIFLLRALRVDRSASMPASGWMTWLRLGLDGPQLRP